MSQSSQPVCKWCAEPLIFGPQTGIGHFCNAACRKQHQRRPGHTKSSWVVTLREHRQQRSIALREQRQQRANAVFKARNRDRSFVLDARYEGPVSGAGIDVVSGEGPYLEEL
jgi:hypothetical protein